MPGVILMDWKVVGLSALFVCMVVLSGLAGYYAVPQPAGDTGDDSDDDETVPNGDDEDGLAPVIALTDSNHPYSQDTSTITIQGAIADEEPANVTVTLRLISPAGLTQIGLYVVSPTADGSWSVSLPLSDPGSWLLTATAEDDDGLVSEATVTVSILPPEEEAVRVRIAFLGPVENSTASWIEGNLTHIFTDTCSISYWPSGQSEVDGTVDEVGDFSIPVDVNATALWGEIAATCGLFSIQTTSFDYHIPYEQPEPEFPDADGDGIVDERDECADTPSDEPVWPDGCSDSQRDTDGDGINDELDECEGYDDTIDVDADGIPDGCDSLVDSDDDGVADADDVCPGFDDNLDADIDGTPDGCDDDDDNDGVNDLDDQCPNTPPGTTVGSDGCALVQWDPLDSFVCTGSGIYPIYDLNPQYGYQSNSNSPFTCEVSASNNGNNMVVDSNGIPNHDFASTLGCCASEQDYEWTIPLNPVNDTDGNFEYVPERGQIAVAVNGAPLFGPEDGPGGDAVALHHKYYNEDRQNVVMDICGGHSGPGGIYHYHWDLNCAYWIPDPGEDMTDYHWTKINSSQHSPIIGWSFDGYPIYGMYGWDESQNIAAVDSSYQLKPGADGYDGIDDWEYVHGMGDLDECNGMFGPTPEYPEGIYHYVSTPLSGSTNTHVDTDGNTVAMVGFPYFQLCYYGEATGGPKGGGGGPPGPMRSVTLYEFGTLPGGDLSDSIEKIGETFDEIVVLPSLLLLTAFAAALYARRT